MAKGNLLSVREDVRVLDATLRDGGLCNDFFFTDEFVSDLYHANIKSGVDYMEFGYKASKDLFDPDKFGKWKFCDDDDIRAIVGENDSPMKIGVMADVGRCDFKRDIRPKNESPVDLIRVATYINTIPVACQIVEHCHKLGYETAINIMAISKERTEDIREALDIFGQTPVNTFYIVDSYGAFYPEQIRRYAKGWKLERISKTALAVLRCALCEILYMDDIPNAAAINEAVELAKGYDEPDTVAFVNGVLGGYMRSGTAK